MGGTFIIIYVIASAARDAQSALQMKWALRLRIWSRKSNIQRYILSEVITLTNFLSVFFPEVDRTGADLILISVTKWQETSVNKCHEHILLIIFIIYLHIFLYTDSHSLIMLWRTFEETTDRVCAVLVFRLSLFSYYTLLINSQWANCLNLQKCQNVLSGEICRLLKIFTQNAHTWGFTFKCWLNGSWINSERKKRLTRSCHCPMQ